MPSKFQDYESYGGGGGDFYRLENGENRIRIMSDFEVMAKHFAEGTMHLCIGAKNGCEWCKRGNKPNTKFMMWILDRKDQQFKVAELGYSIIKQLGELAKSEDWKFDDLPNYDIVIKKTGEGMNTEYFVSPTKPSDLDEMAVEMFKDKESIDVIANKIREKGGVSTTIQVEDKDVSSINF